MDCDKVGDEHLNFHIVPLRTTYIHWPLPINEDADCHGSNGLHISHNDVFAVDLRGTCSFKFLHRYRPVIIFMR